MKSSSYDLLDECRQIGIQREHEVIDVVDMSQKYLDELPKKLTKANSFMILDEVFIIRKKDINGRATKIFHIFRQSDGALVCSVPLDNKEEVIKLVTRKWIAMDL